MAPTIEPPVCCCATRGIVWCQVHSMLEVVFPGTRQATMDQGEINQVIRNLSGKLKLIFTPETPLSHMAAVVETAVTALIKRIGELERTETEIARSKGFTDKRCPICAHHNPDYRVFCGSCGNRIPANALRVKSEYYYGD